MLVPLDDARRHVLRHVDRALPPETVTVAEAVGRVVVERIVAPEPVPPFDNSAMDGFAVRAGDCADPAGLKVTGRTLAGEAPAGIVGSGEAVRIMTGAPVPPGADTIVPIEHVELHDDDTRITFTGEVLPGQHVRRTGDDLAVGAVVVEAGTAVTPAHLGLLATVGVEKVSVVRRPRVGVVSTGDELVEGAAPLLVGQIRDSNRPALLALVAEAGAEAVDLGHAPDDPEAITAAFLRGVTSCDAVLSSGGVSMGDVDLVREVLDLMGEMRWMQVAIRPAKPFAFGLVDGVPVFGLPGNPVSSLVSFELFARPAIRRLAGHPDHRLDRPCPTAIAVDGLPRKPDGKIHFVRVVVRVGAEGRLEARSAGAQGSHHMTGMAAANGLAIVPDSLGIPV
ncbi:MAG TPA: gephyrin-like molybdotransferase Glp, partial [Acidimicrobiales bacterium]|nr:gephyrin-like molybdotransferase Glp [Acidimicrobiales bacterium]